VCNFIPSEVCSPYDILPSIYLAQKDGGGQTFQLSYFQDGNDLE